MRRSWPIAQRHLLAYEGGYSNNPSDPGGVTLNGITQATYDADRKERGLALRKLVSSMGGMPSWIAERDGIYRRRYWQPVEGDYLPGGVDAAVYDYGVNSGVSRAVKVLQRLVGVKDDGIVGVITLDAVKKRDPETLVRAICDERLEFLKQLRTWKVFGKGWAARVADVREYASTLAVVPSISMLPPLPSLPAPSAKGEVPQPKTAKNLTKAAPIIPALAAAHWWEWIAAHPAIAVMIAIAVVVAVGAAITAIEDRRRDKQDAPTPGIGVVREIGQQTTDN